MLLMAVSAAGHNDGQIVTRVIGCVAEVASHHDRCVIKQRAVAFGNLIHIDQELVEVLDNVDFNSA